MYAAPRSRLTRDEPFIESRLHNRGISDDGPTPLLLDPERFRQAPWCLRLEKCRLHISRQRHSMIERSIQGNFSSCSW